MIPFLIYTGKVAILLAVFYLFYRLLMERETFHRLNRAVILLAVLASFVLPFCIITTRQLIQVPETATHVQLSDTATVQTESQPIWPMLILTVYLIGVATKLFQTALSTYRLIRFIRQCEKHLQKDGTAIAVCDQDIAPFSWWNTIVISRRDYEQNDTALLTHEKAHICSYHSLDILLMELVTALQWFNPAIWLMVSELRSVHEYEADAAVLSNGTDIHHYLSLLIERANMYGDFSIANHISQKQLKGRFLMMARKHSKPSKVFKILFSLPIIIATLALNARTVYDTQIIKATPVIRNEIKQQQQQPVVKAQPAPKTTLPKKLRDEDLKDITISGVVVDTDGSPIVGAIINVHDSNQGVITDFDGSYSITVPKGSTLDFMFIGVATHSITVQKEMSHLIITLKKDETENQPSEL